MPQQREIRAVSEMQWRVARAILVDGATDETAAQRLGVKEPTVKTHLKRLYATIDVSSRTELAVRVWSGQLDLIDQRLGSLRAALDRAVQTAA